MKDANDTPNFNTVHLALSLAWVFLFFNVVSSCIFQFGESIQLLQKEIKQMTTPRNNSSNEFLFKILVIGDSGCGKTSFIKRYVHGVFQNQYKATVSELKNHVVVFTHCV